MMAALLSFGRIFGGVTIHLPNPFQDFRIFIHKDTFVVDVIYQFSNGID